MSVYFDSIKPESLCELIKISEFFLDFVVGNVAAIRQDFNTFFREFTFLKEVPICF